MELCRIHWSLAAAVFVLITLTTVQGQDSTFGSVVDKCCDIGKAWFNTSRERCSPHPTPIIGVSRENQMACAAVSDVCCLREQEKKQCQKGKQIAKLTKTCKTLHSVSGQENARECCQCCSLGIKARAAGLKCDIITALKFGSQCAGAFLDCCINAKEPVESQTTAAPTEAATVSRVENGMCSQFPGQLCAQICIDTPGSYKCACNAGFSLMSGGRTCKPDVIKDRCKLSNPCDHQCFDTGSAIHCKCFRGYVLKSDGKTCMDINECSLNIDNCKLDQICTNTIGSYKCDGKDPPKNTGTSGTSGTEAGQGPSIACGPGFAYNRVTRRCDDIDECLTYQHKCVGLHQTCKNTIGSHTCECKAGFSYDPLSQVCEDINECALNQDTCLVGQRCENTDGSFSCRRAINCGTGYTLDKDTQQCVDDNECKLGNHNCGAARECRNTPGSFRCVPKRCPVGYRLSFRTGLCVPLICTKGTRANVNGLCDDINECIEDPTVCKANEECRNTIGSYICKNLINCGPGYELAPDGARCTDVNECVTGSHKCTGAKQKCVNRPGTYLCQCPEGYQMNHSTKSCEDIDECVQYGGQVCAPNAQCENTPGSFLCLCKKGYRSEQNGRVCKDIDECAQGSVCQHNCRNTWGSFQCTCFDGYQLAANGKSCEDVDECKLWADRGQGQLCVGLCQNVPGSYTCACPKGYQMLGDGRTCRDIDECASRIANCNGPDQVCINTRGGHKCETIVCPKGFVRAASRNNRNNNIRCQRRSFVCPRGDTDCLYAPLSYSVNFITFPSKIRIPADLFTMRGPYSSYRRLAFQLRLVSARDPITGETRVSRSYFKLEVPETRKNEAVVRLLKEVPGSQDIELQLNMNIYSTEFDKDHKELFFGTAVAKIHIFVTKSDCLFPFNIYDTDSTDPLAATRGRGGLFKKKKTAQKMEKKDLADLGVYCRRLKCGTHDIECLLNTTKSLQWQHVVIPSMPFVPPDEAIVLLTVRAIGYTIYPKLHFSIVQGNINGTFDVIRTPLKNNQGILRLVKPITGPRIVNLVLKMDNRNKADYVVTSHLAYVTVYISEYFF